MTARVPLKSVLPGLASDEQVRARLTYRTKTSFVGVHFNEAGKGQIVFLPSGAILCVIGRSPLLSEGIEVNFGCQICNVFEVDLATRSTLILEPTLVKGRALAVCA